MSAYVVTISSAVTSSSVANPSVITAAWHGFATGDSVTIAGHSGSTPSINGTHTVTRISASTFSIPVNVTVGGTGGTATAACDIRSGTLSIEEQANGINVASFDVASADGTFRPALDAEVIITEDATRIYGGTVQSVPERWLRSADWSGIVTRVNVSDFSLCTQWRHIDATLAGGTLKSQLTTLVNDYLDDYGISLHASQVNGPTMAAQIGNNRTIQAILDDLSVQSDGYVWKIDYDKVLRMFIPTTQAAPFDVVDGNGKAIGDVTVEPVRTNGYANRVIVQYGTGTRPANQSFTADGSTNSWTTDLRASSILVNVFIYNGDQVPIGPYEPGDPTSLWLYQWDPETHTIYQRSGDADAVNGTTLEINYEAQYPNVVTVNDTGEQAIRGIRDVLVSAPDVFEVDAATAIGNAELARRTELLYRARYDTYGLGLKVSQSQTITLADRNVNAAFTIESIETNDPERVPAQLIRHVTAIQSPVLQPDFRKVYKDWLGGGTGAVSSVPFTSYIATGGADYLGDGHPQGQQVGNPGQTYRDTTNNKLYFKVVGIGTNTGWYRFFPHIDQPSSDKVISAISTYNATLTTRGWSATLFTGTTRFDVYPSGYGQMTEYRSTSGTGDDAGFFNTDFSAATFRWSDDFDQSWHIRTGSVITNLRYSIGLGTANPTSDTYSGHFIIWRFSSASDGSDWQLLTNDNTTQNLTVMDPIAASTLYVLRVRKVESTVYASMDDGDETPITSNVPSSGQPYVIFRVTTTGGAVARNLDFGRFQHVYAQ